MNPCKHCGCTELNPCRLWPFQKPCKRPFETKPDVCSNASCLREEADASLEKALASQAVAYASDRRIA